MNNLILVSKVPLKIDNKGVKRKVKRELTGYGRNLKTNQYYTTVKDTLVDVDEVTIIDKIDGEEVTRTRQVVTEVQFWREKRYNLKIESINTLFKSLPDEIVHSNGDFDKQDLNMYSKGLLLDTIHTYGSTGFLGTREWGFLKV